MNGSHGHLDTPPQKGIPTLITWNYGGNEVAVEGSWDNWKSRYSIFNRKNPSKMYDFSG